MSKSCNCPAPPGENCPLTAAECRSRTQETPGEAFRRVRKQRNDKVVALSATLNVSTSHINYAERDMRQIPRRWLRDLPPEYAAAIVPIWIAELEELLPKSERPRQGEPTGPPLQSRNVRSISRAKDDAKAQDKSIACGKRMNPAAPQPIGCPPAVARYGESPEARAFRRYPVGRKLWAF